MIIRVIDLETTGTEKSDHVVEIGYVDVVDGAVSPDRRRQSFVRPPIKIPPESMAIHHITDDVVAIFKTWPDVCGAFLDTDGSAGINVFAAHNAVFERMFIDPIRGAAWVCTYKCALRAWPDLKSHSNHAIRYAKNLPVNAADAEPVHRALPDAYVTAHIVVELLKEHSLDELIAWSAEPPVMPTCPIGDEWRGKKWGEVDKGFLQWCLDRKGMSPDIVWNVKREFQRRDDELEAAMLAKREGYTGTALALIEQAATVEDLRCWFAWEADSRTKHGIYPGTEWYSRIVDACKARSKALPPEIPRLRTV